MKMKNKELTVDDYYRSILGLKIRLLAAHRSYQSTRNRDSRDVRKMKEMNIQQIRADMMNQIIQCQAEHPFDMMDNVDDIYTPEFENGVLHERYTNVTLSEFLSQMHQISIDVHNDIVMFNWLHELKSYA